MSSKSATKKRGRSPSVNEDDPELDRASSSDFGVARRGLRGKGADEDGDLEGQGKEGGKEVKGFEEYAVSLQNADVLYIPDFVPSERATEWYDELMKLESWYQPTLKVYGKAVTQSRKIATYATDPQMTLKYSGQRVEINYDYPPALRAIQDLVEEKLGIKFDHVMLNLYENGGVYIGQHRDNLDNNVIASLSLGAKRTFHMTYSPVKSIESSKGKTKKRKVDTTSSQPGKTKWALDNGSLVVMQGDTQKYWKHEIPKEPKVKKGRISLTFRQLLPT